MDVGVYFAIYNAFGGHPTLSLIGDYLIQGAPSFGDALNEIEVTIHFRSNGPPRKTLEGLFEKFHAAIARLPRVIFHRQKRKAEVSFYSELATGSELESRELSLSLFCGACREVAENLGRLRKRLSKDDQFDFSAFQLWLDKRLSELPNTLADLTAIRTAIEKQREAKRASLTEWEKLGIDFDDFHSDARSILDDPRLWDVCDDFSPNGNDTGADVLGMYRDWYKRHRTTVATPFFDKLMSDWEVSVSPDNTNDYSRHTYSQAIVGLAFAQLKLHSTCDPAIASLALKALRCEAEHELTDKMATILQAYVPET